MEKLIRFINEYGHTSNCWPFETCRIEPATDYTSSYLVLSWDDNWEWDWKDWFLEIPRLISKEYWFIKWLVENDKIDKKKIDTRLVRNVESHYDEEWYWVENSYEDYSDTDTLLMLLSISDTPIEDLISYLK